MRHSHASHAIAAGMPIEIAQQNLGACVAGHDDGLCDDREQATDAGSGEVLGKVRAPRWRPEGRELRCESRRSSTHCGSPGLNEPP